ncbi:MAG: Veg family protein [Coriobacteriia bacterium]|nr:Veg family protein [Coriobacteriia bacterium]
METIKQVETVGRIRSDLEGLMGSRMCLKANMGRSKILEREGVLEQTHPSLFVLKIDEKRGRTARVSYSYVDILTGTVELTHPETGEGLFPWLN